MTAVSAFVHSPFCFVILFQWTIILFFSQSLMGFMGHLTLIQVVKRWAFCIDAHQLVLLVLSREKECYYASFSWAFNYCWADSNLFPLFYFLLWFSIELKMENIWISLLTRVLRLLIVYQLVWLFMVYFICWYIPNWRSFHGFQKLYRPAKEDGSY